MAALRKEKGMTAPRKRPLIREVHVNFEDIDAVRRFVRKWRKGYLKKTDRQHRFLHSFSYRSAYFAVGRNATYVRFVKLNLPVFSIVRLAQTLATEYPRYSVYYDEQDIHVYLRGIPYWERRKV